ncbi:hypothetical protein NA56DRAFT_310025 [Hyaloscypha hepaticicola]|uniref:Uncharacterized protein n=1 Tax=Hyaloscypha hepaticicola TaxID=2082293 RepID=A0A2J6PR27_9HELO|nr:hypothetical protein NA56DRAFT_310025 [Hyaloscypha hepaticicola]
MLVNAVGRWTGRCRKNPGSRTRTRTRTGFRHLHAGPCGRCYDLNPTTSPPFASPHALPRDCTVCMQKQPDLRVRLRALTVTALVWSTDLPLRTMLIGFISPMEVLSIERIYVHLYIISVHGECSTVTRREPVDGAKEPAASGDGGRRAADGGRLPRQGLGATATATYRFLHST